MKDYALWLFAFFFFFSDNKEENKVFIMGIPLDKSSKTPNRHITQLQLLPVLLCAWKELRNLYKQPRNHQNV